ncbi:MAG: serine phosphatase RsbU (regulator of sigma subunit) [Paraglaciecola sp.]|jgi:serine phosphatase RsbU (regulator of sigma subunit)
MFFGIVESHEFESEVERYVMQFGDRLVAYSDGIIELENEPRKMLGDEDIESG